MGEGVCRLIICYQVAAFVIPFNLICNRIMFILVAYSHSLFQTFIILFDLLLVPVTIKLTAVFLTSFILFFCKKKQQK